MPRQGGSRCCEELCECGVCVLVPHGTLPTCCVCLCFNVIVVYHRIGCRDLGGDIVIDMDDVLPLLAEFVVSAGLAVALMLGFYVTETVCLAAS